MQKEGQLRLIRWTRRGNIEPDYSAAVAEKFLIGFDKNDYDFISGRLANKNREWIHFIYIYQIIGH